MNEFQAKAMETAVYPERGGCVLYPLLGLIDEVGEVAGAAMQGWEHPATLMGDDELVPGDLPAGVVVDLVYAVSEIGVAVGRLKKVYRDGDGVLDDEVIAGVRSRLMNAIDWARDVDIVLQRLAAIPAEERPRLSLAESRTKFTNKKKIADELGDVQYYVAAVASEFAYTLGEIGRRNNAKLADRQARGVLHGSGDDR
jgi:NTP pyrophosphatase (non-canonical NTP hydrolase)